MREFVLLSLNGRTSEFDLNDLTFGRIDLVCRAVSSALFVSDHIRRDTNIYVFLNGSDNPPKMISFIGETIKDITPDEKTISRLILAALKKGRSLVLEQEIEVSPGIRVAKKSFEKFVKEKSKENKLFYLSKKGTDIRNLNSFQGLFILGDNLGLPKKTEKLLKNLNAYTISLGPAVLFASHCIILVHNEIDRK